MVIAPEHPFVQRLTTPEQKAAVDSYCQAAASKSDRERQEVGKKKSGVFTGSYAINPVSGQQVPIWIADYVLISYGTGAIMAVPAHDERDFEFAKVFGLPIVPVVDPGSMVVPPTHVLHPAGAKPATTKVTDIRDEVLAGRECFEGLGIAINSGKYSGLPTADFKRKITADLAAAGIGREAVNYKLRDWLFSRQRFWGEPFPILHELDDAGQPTGLIRAVDEKDLPVDLPHLDDFKPVGKVEGTLKQDGTRSVPATNPLAKAPDAWLYPVIDGKKYRRETNTMPQWAGSCWYYLRFIDPKNDQAFVDREKEKEWMPVDLYVGGAEHAVLHLLYSRFWHKVLFDRGHVSTAEPFKKLVNQGMILGEMEYTGYRGESGWISAGDVQDDEEGTAVLKSTGEKLTSVRLSPEQILKKGEGFVLKERPEIRIESRAYKMSKSRGNVINPDTIVRQYGADSLRLYEMFMGPLEQVKPWSMAGVSGVRGFLDRVWRLIVDDKAEKLVLNVGVQDVEPTDEAARVLHKTIKQVTGDLTRMEFNTAIARMMEFTNYFTKQSVRPLAVMEQFVLLLSPFAPHIAEELWQLLGNHQTLAYEPWPSYDEALTQDAEVEIPVQILGKLRSKVTVPADSDQETIVTAAKADARIAELLSGKEIVKTIVVPGKLVNFVVK
jgi:leucyl-tRNA synthetase